ncbi:MAG TPA: vanadium-dependent haloperoxidase, partial [Vicinamibacterales bacterium]
FRPLGPPSLTSTKYANDVNEVKSFGSATGSARSDDQTTIALFWADGAGTETPPGHWNSIAATVALSRTNTLQQNARLFALLNMAMADAAICAWDAKYRYDFWRPVTAIRNADADGNDLTTADPLWQPLIATPPFPEYMSGHSTFSAAAAVVLARFYGTDDVQFMASSDVTPLPRAFSSFSAAANEAAASRLYGGIHFRSAIEDGLTSGTEIGEWVVAHVLQQGENRSR